ncbi:hypothetical protein PS896_01080 [Pseudomonas fluorescens]|uniref:Terminase n=1 Tax=Pseudomonas fluorescens TaxID=294 RepID=A0A5E7HPM6_PSEFL|nr:phage terminase small subunit [Pseudomonas fluorescens]VVO66204.1 hypothetical protein PS896_01080 [Pseudomonas fluorescens]
MTNPYRRHFVRVSAAIEAAAANPTQTMAGATAYEHQLNQLLQDRLRLKQVQSNQGKAELKRQLLPDYIPYVQGVLEGRKGAQDEVLTTIMVWRIDAEDFSGALDIADYVLKHKLIMPDRFERTTGCLVAEEIASNSKTCATAAPTNSVRSMSSLQDSPVRTSASPAPEKATEIPEDYAPSAADCFGKSYESSRKFNLAGWCLRTSLTCSLSTIATTLKQSSGPLRIAGMWDFGECLMLNISESPSNVVAYSWSQVLDQCPLRVLG